MSTPVSSQNLFKHAAHIGHKTQKWNPKMKSYLSGAKEGIHLFDLDKTAIALNQALDALKRAASADQTILFCSTKLQTIKPLQEIHEETGMPIVVHRWLGGLLTNFPTVKERIFRLKSLRRQKETGELKRYTKKEQLQLGDEEKKLEKSLGGVVHLRKLPDILFVVDGKKDIIAVHEANRCNITVIGIADSNVDPDLYDLLIPSNDDACKTLHFILGLVKEAIMEGQKNKINEKGDPLLITHPHKDS